MMIKAATFLATCLSLVLAAPLKQVNVPVLTTNDVLLMAKSLLMAKNGIQYGQVAADAYALNATTNLNASSTLNATAGFQTGPYSFTDCNSLATDISFWQSMTCLRYGQPDPGCEYSRDLQLDNMGTLWDQFCASPSATPSSSPDASFPTYMCQCIEYETLKPNILCLSDMDASMDSEGLVLVGGDADLRAGYSIGKLGGPNLPTMLIVGQDLNFPGGHVMGDISVGGNANVGSSVINSGSVVSSSFSFDFAGARAHFEQVSDRLCNLADTGSVSKDGASLITLRGNAATEVFTLTDDLLAGSTTLDFTGISASASVVVNIRSSDVNFKLTQIAPNGLGRNTVYNFCNANDITLFNIKVDGSIIAPRATIFGKGGVVFGQIVGDTFRGDTQFNDYECNACL